MPQCAAPASHSHDTRVSQRETSTGDTSLGSILSIRANTESDPAAASTDPDCGEVIGDSEILFFVWRRNHPCLQQLSSAEIIQVTSYK